MRTGLAHRPPIVTWFVTWYASATTLRSAFRLARLLLSESVAHNCCDCAVAIPRLFAHDDDDDDVDVEVSVAPSSAERLRVIDGFGD